MFLYRVLTIIIVGPLLGFFRSVLQAGGGPQAVVAQRGADVEFAAAVVVELARVEAVNWLSAAWPFQPLLETDLVAVSRPWFALCSPRLLDWWLPCHAQ